MNTSSNAVLVTGASGDIGLETSLTLAERGFQVWAAMRNLAQQSRVESMAEARRVQIRAVQMDVTDPASVAQAVERVTAESRGLYGVVNNAAIMMRGYFEDLSDAEIRTVFETNLFGVMNVTRCVLPHLRAARRGRIINLSSIGGRIGSMALTAYVASKFALEGFSESLYLEVKPLGIDVVIVEPGIVQTDIWSKRRNIAERARDPLSPYYAWFNRAETAADTLVKTSTLRPPVVARSIAQAMTVKRPKLRYTIGTRASAVLSLRRHLPGETFERIYLWSEWLRVTVWPPTRRRRQEPRAQPPLPDCSMTRLSSANLPAAVDRAVPLSTKLMYAIGEVPITTSMALFGLFVMFFYGSVMQLPPALVGIGSAIGLMFDAAVDPYIGYRFDTSKSRLGHRHSFMVAGCVSMGISFYLLMSPPQGMSTVVLFMWLLVTTMLFRFTSALYRVTYLALGAEMSADYDERTPSLRCGRCWVCAGRSWRPASRWCCFSRYDAGCGSQTQLFGLSAHGGGVRRLYDTHRSCRHCRDIPQLPQPPCGRRSGAALRRVHAGIRVVAA